MFTLPQSESSSSGGFILNTLGTVSYGKTVVLLKAENCSGILRYWISLPSPSAPVSSMLSYLALFIR